VSSEYSLEEIVQLKEKAENGIDLLKAHAEKYKTDLEDYNHTENFETSLESSRNVTKDMLRETTQQTIAILEEHEPILEDLLYIEQNIPDQNKHKVIDGSTISPEEIEKEIKETIDEYRDSFEAVWRVGYRIYKNPELEADPINMKYKQWERSFEQEQFPEKSIENYNKIFT